MGKLVNYIISLANLNGVIHKEIVLDIYNYMNDEKVSGEEIEAYFGEGRELVTDTVYSIDPYFVHERVWDFRDLAQDFIEKQRNFYYVPDEKTLFKYLDYHYIEKTEAYWRLHDFVGKHFYAGNPSAARDFCEEVFKRLQFGITTEGIMGYELSKLGLEAIDNGERQSLRELLDDFSLDIRKWLNNGYTDRELKRTFALEGEKENVISFKISR